MGSGKTSSQKFNIAGIEFVVVAGMLKKEDYDKIKEIEDKYAKMYLNTTDASALKYLRELATKINVVMGGVNDPVLLYCQCMFGLKDAAVVDGLFKKNKVRVLVSGLKKTEFDYTKG